MYQTEIKVWFPVIKLVVGAKLLIIKGTWGIWVPKKSLLNIFKSYSNYFLITLTLFTCIISFQNCTMQLDQEQIESSSTAQSDPSPFAYNFEIDHLAVMTCPNSSLNQRYGGFTIKWGAYRNGLAVNKGGLGFSQEWLNKNGNYQQQAMATLLNNSIKNKDLYLVSGYFKTNRLKDGILASVWNSTQDNTFMHSNPKSMPIDSYRHQLIEAVDSKHSYFSRIPVSSNGTKSRLEGHLHRDNLPSINLNSNDTFTETMSNYRNFGSRLHIGFSKGDKIDGASFFLLNSDGDYQDSSAVGYSYWLDYHKVGASDRYLKSVQERDTLTGQNTSSNWNCPQDLRFMIIDRRDLGKSTTPTFQPTQISSAAIAGNRVLQTITNIIDPAYWDIDFSNKRIVRKISENNSYCYNKSNYIAKTNEGVQVNFDLIVVDYNQSSCLSYPNNIKEGNRVGNRNLVEHHVCPHYVSICFR